MKTKRTEKIGSKMNELKKINKTLLEGDLKIITDLRNLRKQTQKRKTYYDAQIDFINYLLGVENNQKKQAR